jgi:hypothetical protein
LIFWYETGLPATVSPFFLIIMFIMGGACAEFVMLSPLGIKTFQAGLGTLQE